MTVIIGIDPHENSHTATALGADLVELGTIRVRATRATIDQLLAWAQPWPERRWAIEGATDFASCSPNVSVYSGVADPG